MLPKKTVQMDSIWIFNLRERSSILQMSEIDVSAALEDSGAMQSLKTMTIKIIKKMQTEGRMLAPQAPKASSLFVRSGFFPRHFMV
mmetsp:Transcript_22677/g.45272  ORF Transcript_22677/g.45272 Transcript_22677/m.45272 type:complete len:86 (-) Transcript_22677:70-327(-)